MQKGKIYKGTAIVLFALIFIGAVAAGNSELLRAVAGGDFNFGIFLYIAAFGLLACIPVYGTGDILETSCACKCGNDEKENEASSCSCSDGWICKKCSVKNENISTFCKNCGEYK